MSKSSIAIIDTGIGNLASIGNMLNKCGRQADVINDPRNLLGYRKIILPGVGNFKAGMVKLRERGFYTEIIDLARREDTQILGICLGMHLLCRFSEEGNELGLGLVPADVKKFSFNQTSVTKIPHMGWNLVKPTKKSKLFEISQLDARFYFVHSYKVVPDDLNIISATADYGGEFCAAFECKNIFGVQFHPEKSHKFGVAFFHRFLGV